MKYETTDGPPQHPHYRTKCSEEALQGADPSDKPCHKARDCTGHTRSYLFDLVPFPLPYLQSDALRLILSAPAARQRVPPPVDLYSLPSSVLNISCCLILYPISPPFFYQDVLKNRNCALRQDSFRMTRKCICRRSITPKKTPRTRSLFTSNHGIMTLRDFCRFFSFHRENQRNCGHLSIVCNAEKSRCTVNQKLHSATAFAYAAPSQIA